MWSLGAKVSQTNAKRLFFLTHCFFYNGTEHYLSNRADQISSLLSGESDYEPNRRSREDGVADRFPVLDIGKHTTEGNP